MQETRQRILEIIKRRGQVTVEDLSRELELTAVTVRHHLEVLRRNGVIAPPKAVRKGGPGRPQHVYRLAEEADDLFPKSYDRLAEALLAELEERLSPEEMESLVSSVAHRLAAGVNLPVGEGFEARLSAALAFMNETGYLASLEKSEDGRLAIRIANCPYGRVARHHPPTCEIGARMIAELAGVDARAVERQMEKPGRCVYLLPTA